MTLQELNSLSSADAAVLFRQCCNAGRWARAMADGRPYPDVGALASVAAISFRSLADEDWMEAFGGIRRSAM